MGGEPVGPAVLEGEIHLAYRWTTGPATGAFLTALRDRGVILGLRCPSCRRVLCPPLEVCPRCGTETAGEVECGPGGRVTAWTLVEAPTPWTPWEAPYALISVRLDGASTDLVHAVTEGARRVRTGARVKAVFRTVGRRVGDILDLEGFAVE
ncbi:MAG: Zn-ribbon domain-containing OB-fold protein [Planctomycetes bacterium]|nr:Zn-ribbon domain-containing OB-fold protein [Planctomycetota bacterium]